MASASIRDIIEIDEELCDGCGLCVPSCAEGALAVIDGKVRVVNDALCDGMGACLGHCPKGALKVIQRPAPAFDEKLVHAPKPAPLRVLQAHAQSSAGGCPSAKASQWKAKEPEKRDDSPLSQLEQWPVQLHLVSPMAPFWSGKEMLLAADCSAFSHGGFHREFLAGRSLAIACPKLDNSAGYLEKLVAILAGHEIPALRVLIMEVPCCRGLAHLALQAAKQADYRGEIEIVVISRQGQELERRTVQESSLGQ